MSKRRIEIEFWLWAFLVVAILIGLQLGPMLSCPGECYVDTGALHGKAVGYLEGIDIRLNSWILAWTQNALLSPGRNFFDAGMLYPAPAALAGSEHLIGPALLTLPVRIFSNNAVLNYSVAVTLSSLILGLSTATLARWATQSRALGVLAAAIALLMPWRVAEISHLQLLSAGFIPLILYFELRLLLGDEKYRTSLGLFLALGGHRPDGLPHVMGFVGEHSPVPVCRLGDAHQPGAVHHIRDISGSEGDAPHSLRPSNVHRLDPGVRMGALENPPV